jgi:DNA-directed RNA polymerase specialized sigma24 family protein
VALVARAKRELLLRAHRHRLRQEDLEDCYSQAALELVAQARKGRVFSSRIHLGHVLEQRFVSRINDRRRALSGRSPMQAAMEGALCLGGSGEQEVEIADPRGDPETLVMLRDELSRVERLAREQLTRDQRLVLACQTGLPLLSPREFCGRFGWSHEKYRKVAQRARARLRHLMAADEEPYVPAVGRRRNSD